MMSDLERLTITLTPELAALVRGAIGEGDYASSSEVIRDALRDWRHKRQERAQTFKALQGVVQAGLEDDTQGRVQDFDAADIKAAGRAKSRRAG